MRIGVDVRCFAEGRRSGVEEYTESLLRAMFDADRENEYVLFFNAWRGRVPDFSWATQYPNVTLRVFRIPNKLLNLALWYLRWPKMDRLLGGVEVMFLPNIAFAAVSRKTRLVVTAHDLSFKVYPETFSWKRRAWHFFVAPPSLFRRADRIVAVSQSTADDLMRHYRIPASQIAVVHSGCHKRFRVMDRNDLSLLRVKEKYRLPYRFVLFLGAFEPRKNIVGMVRAWEALMATGHPQLASFVLVLAGVAGWKETMLRQVMRRSPARTHIRMIGYVDDADKPALYNLATAFVYPSLYEGFGFPPVEALSCGVPVIASHNSSFPEILGDAALLVDPYKPDELFRALEQVVTDADLTRLLKERGFARATRFSWKKTAQTMQKIFQNLA